MAEPAIEWREYPRIAPGVYRAYSRMAKVYFEKGFRRWVCFIRWDVFSDDMRVIARVPLWWNLGGGEKPRAQRRKYLVEWVFGPTNNAIATVHNNLFLRITPYLCKA